MIIDTVSNARIEGRVLGNQIFYTLERYAGAQEERAALIDSMKTRMENDADFEGVYLQTGKSIDTIVCEMQKIMDVLACRTTDENY